MTRERWPSASLTTVGGFDPAGTPEGAGLQNIRDRVEDLGGRFKFASCIGHGS